MMDEKYLQISQALNQYLGEFKNSDTDESIKYANTINLESDLTKENILSFVDSILTLSSPNKTCENTQIFILHLKHNNDEFWLEFYLTDCYCFITKQTKPGLKLFSLVLPKKLKRQGIGSEILGKLEALAKEKHLIFAVDPVIEESMSNLLIKRGYQHEFFIRYCFHY